MHPIEQLRYLARGDDTEPTALAVEAAEALGDLASEPRALVPACRRLLEFHPLVGPLWSVCAELLLSAEPRATARRAARALLDDPTVEEAAYALPSTAVIAAGCSASVAEALLERPDCEARLVGAPLEVRRAMAQLRAASPALGFAIDELDEALHGATLVLVEADAAGSDGVVLSRSAAALVRAAAAAGVPVWLVAGVGRVLPPTLFAACAARADPGRLVVPSAVDVVVGPNGPVERGDGLASRAAAPAELVTPAERPAVPEPRRRH